MIPHFDTVTIIGVGLLGGSLGLALKKRGMVGTVRGVGHRRATLEEALRLNAIDEIAEGAAGAARDADLIVVCTPAAVVPEWLDELLPLLKPSAVVTDVASTKAAICSHAEKTWPRPYRFIGSHPMAGSEKYGPEHADSRLYEDRYVVVAACDGAAPRAAQTVRDLWEAVGAKVVMLDPAQHDALVARTSHVPHVLASCIALLSRCGADVRPLAGPGFRDMTRVADGRPELWRDICLTNGEAIVAALDEAIQHLKAVREHVAAQDAEALQAFFELGRHARREVLGP